MLELVGWLCAVFGRRRIEALRAGDFLDVGWVVRDEEELRRGNRKGGGVVEGVGVAVADVKLSSIDLKSIGYSR